MSNKWSVELLNKAYLAVESEKAQLLAEHDSKYALEVFLQKIVDDYSDADPTRDAYRVYYGISCIAMFADATAPSDAQVTKLERLIKSILLRNKVKPRKSQLGHIYRETAETVGYYYGQKGNPDAAIWEASIGHTLAQGSSQKPSETSQSTYANLALNNGSTMLAGSLYRQLKENTSSKFWFQVGLVGEIKSLRLAGQREKFSELLLSFNDLDVHENLKEHVLWEQLMQELPSNLDAWIQTHKEECKIPSFAVRLAILLYAQPNPASHLETIKKLRRSRGSVKKAFMDQKTKVAIRAWEIFDRLYDSSVPFELRLRNASVVMEMVSKMYIDTRCTTLVALQRWVMKNSQNHLSLLVEDEYRSLSHRLSQGKSPDVLNLMDNVGKGRRFLQDVSAVSHAITPISFISAKADLVSDDEGFHSMTHFRLGA